MQHFDTVVQFPAVAMHHMASCQDNWQGPFGGIFLCGYHPLEFEWHIVCIHKLIQLNSLDNQTISNITKAKEFFLGSDYEA